MVGEWHFMLKTVPYIFWCVRWPHHHEWKRIWVIIYKNYSTKRHSYVWNNTLHRAPQNDNDSHQRFLNTPNNCLKKIDFDNQMFPLWRLAYNYDLAKVAEKSNVNDFVELMADHSFFSIINKPTRITDTCATVLDHIWTNSFSTITKCAVITHPLSDHMLVIMCASTEGDNANNRHFWKTFYEQSYGKIFQ